MTKEENNLSESYLIAGFFFAFFLAALVYITIDLSHAFFCFFGGGIQIVIGDFMLRCLETEEGCEKE